MLGVHVYSKKLNWVLAHLKLLFSTDNATCHFSLINYSHLRTSLPGFHKGASGQGNAVLGNFSSETSRVLSVAGLLGSRFVRCQLM